MDEVVVVGSLAVVGLLAGCAGLVAAYYGIRRASAAIKAGEALLAGLQERMSALEEARAGAQKFARSGVEAREQYQARRQEALMAGLKLYQEAAGKADFKAILVKLAGEYPDVAAQYAANPLLVLQDAKKLGVSLPPELVQGFLSRQPSPSPQEQNTGEFGNYF